MNPYIEILEVQGCSVWDITDLYVQAIAFETSRVWIDEIPGEYQLEEHIEPLTVSLLITAKGALQWLRGDDPDAPLILPEMQVSPEDLPSVIRNLRLAFSDEVPMEKGSSVVQSVLNAHSIGQDADKV